MITRRVRFSVLPLACVVLSQYASADMNPLDFASLGAFPTAPGGYVVDTTLGQAPTIKFNGGTITGVISGDTAVFDFNSVAITSSMSFTVNGGKFSRLSGGQPVDSYKFALLSRGDLSLATGSSITGTTNFFEGSGPPGGGLGGLGSPSNFTGDGGGRGGGHQSFAGGGGGGGNGGSGGAPGTLFGHDPGSAGAAGGGDGSGGGGAQGGGRGPGGTGGNGGGSIELGALGAVVIGGTIDVHATDGTLGNGGGGGGSGGTISLHGDSVALVGTLIGYGGNGGDSSDAPGTGGNGGGGGGGGGLVLIHSRTGAFLDNGTINLSGGIGGVDPVVPGRSGNAGDPGTIVVGTQAVPEPSSLALAIVGAAGIAMMAHRRRI
jgi:hypothetical protein